jgi:hypothetical protein
MTQVLTPRNSNCWTWNESMLSECYNLHGNAVRLPSRVSCKDLEFLRVGCLYVLQLQGWRLLKVIATVDSPKSTRVTLAGLKLCSCHTELRIETVAKRPVWAVVHQQLPVGVQNSSKVRNCCKAASVGSCAPAAACRGPKLIQSQKLHSPTDGC